MPKHTLHYFDFRARAEIARLIFAAAGADYEDKRYDYAAWGPDSQAKAGTPLGQLPYLEIDGVKLPQSISIARYLAREFNLQGKDNVEQAKADAVVDTALDLLNFYFSKGLYKADRNGEDWSQFKQNELKKHLGNIDKIIGMYGSNGHSASDSLLWSDLFVFDVTSQLLRNDLSLLDDYPNVKKVVETVQNDSKVGNYIKNRVESTI